MRFPIVLFVVLWVAGPLSAQTLVVRSGEHDTFSRLVIDLPDGATYSVRRRNKGATVSLQPKSIALNPANVFVRIPRTRVRRVRTNGSELILSFACDCSLETSLTQDGMLVLDIRNAPPKQSDILRRQKDIETASPSRGAVRQSEFGYGELIWSPVRQLQPLEKGAKNSLEPRSEDIVSSSERDWEDPTARSRHSSGLQQITTEIGKAATKGFLEPAQVLEPTSDTRPKVVESAPKTGSVVPLTDLASNISVETGMDRPHFPPQKQERTPQGEQCPDPLEIDVTKWGVGNNFETEIARHLTDLHGEFDRLNPKAALSLAHTYIYFGFGVEARRVLELDADLAEQHRYLLVISDILETGHGQPENDLLPFLACDSVVAFWSSVARPDFDQFAEADENAVLRGLNSLPRHLREYLGPTLSTRFASSGNTEIAEKILRIVERSTLQTGPDTMMAQAEIADAKGEAEHAEDLFDEVVKTNSVDSPIALIRLIDTSLKTNQPVSVNIATLAAAYAHEYRDTEIGPELRRVHVLARARSNQFQIAFEALERLQERDGTSDYGGLRSRVAQLLAENGSDADFLYFAFAHPNRTELALDNSARTAIAIRLLALGFAEMSLPVLPPVEAGDANTDRRVIRARIALAQERPERAMGELSGLVGKEVDLLRARSLAMSGAYGQAQKIYELHEGQDARTNSMALLSEDWDRLAQVEDPAVSRLAKLINRRNVPILAADTAEKSELSIARTLLSSSEELRSTVQLLLPNAASDAPSNP